MQSKHEKTLESILSWLKELQNLRIEDINREEQSFGIQLASSNLDEHLPIYIIGLKDRDDIILIGWIKLLHPSDKFYFQKVKRGKIEEMVQNLSDSAASIDMQINFKPTIESPEYIESQKVVIVEGLTKVKLRMCINDSIMGLKLLKKALLHNLSIPSKFDASSGI